jgi:hypothetical protein
VWRACRYWFQLAYLGGRGSRLHSSVSRSRGRGGGDTSPKTRVEGKDSTETKTFFVELQGFLRVFDTEHEVVLLCSLSVERIKGEKDELHTRRYPTVSAGCGASVPIMCEPGGTSAAIGRGFFTGSWECNWEFGNATFTTGYCILNIYAFIDNVVERATPGVRGGEVWSHDVGY